MASYYRPDFVTLTACCAALYFLEDPGSVRLSSFRGLVAIIFGSLAYDLVWSMINDFDESPEGGIEARIRGFALFVSYVSFFFRVSTTPFANLSVDSISTRLLEGFSGLCLDNKGQGRLGQRGASFYHGGKSPTYYCEYATDCLIL